MTTASDHLQLPSASMLPDVAGDLYVDDEDAAGYQAMMSELPTIVSMSGLLDDDFDELHEIQNLLAPPVSDDDDENHAAAAAAVAAEVAEDAYIQSMVPNPIPTSGFPSSSSGLDVSATAAALDENLGFPSTSLLTTDDISGYHYYHHQAGDTASVTSNSLTVKAPTKRVHKELDVGIVTPIGYTPPAKKTKVVSTVLAQTPATLRTSLDGVSAPNPLLFGRPIQIPAPPQLPDTADLHDKEPMTVEVSPIKPKSPIRHARASRSLYPTLPTLPKAEPPKLRVALKPIAPEIISSYPAPTFLTDKLRNKRPPLCKLLFMGKVEPVEGTPDSAIARIPAPPKTINLVDISPACQGDDCNVNNTDSATASKKKASNKAKKPTKAKKKSVTTKGKKVGPTPAVKAEEEVLTVAKTEATPVPPAAAVPESSPPVIRTEELMVANPLANVPPTAPIKMLPVPKPKTVEVTAPAPIDAPPAVVSSNSSAASDEDHEEDFNDEKKPDGKPLSAEEKAQACRDRNRQHARNTRLRKKAYVEELKRSLMDMVEERDREIAAVNEEKAKKEQLRSNRKRVLHDFLQLRGRNEQEEAKWAQLVEDTTTFQLTLPATKFRATVHELSPSVPEQVLTGVQDVMADTAYLASFLQTLGNTEKADEQAAPIYLHYQCDETRLLMDGSTGILAWTATTCGAVSQGAKSEMQFAGTVHGTFCTETEKLVSTRLLFDTGAIQAQLTQPPHV